MEEFVQRLDTICGEIQRDNFCKPVELMVELGDVVVRQIEDVNVVMFLAEGKLVQFGQATASGAMESVTSGAAHASVGTHSCKSRCN